MFEWISVEDELPSKMEPVVYRRPYGDGTGRWLVGIAYWTVSKKWNPEAQSVLAPTGFTHWFDLSV